MKILAIADRGPQQDIVHLVQKESIDLIVTLGDLDLHELLDLKKIIDIPKIGVYGNHCSGTYFEALGIKNMHLETFEYMGKVFGGFEGSHKYKQSSYAKMYTQEEADHLLKNYARVDVFLSHSPPFGINDEPESMSHQGFHALKKYLDIHKPQYFLHGHTYPTADNIISTYNETQIIYVHEEEVLVLN